MARAKTDTLLALDTWAEILGIDSFGFNQLYVNQLNAGNSCNSIFYQFEWQRDYLSREEIARAIAKAELAIAQQLNFYPAPKYIPAEPVKPLYARNARPRTGYGWPAYNWNRYPLFDSIQLKWHKIRSGGVLARTSIGDTVNLTYSDSDGDGINDVFTCSIVTTVTDPYEIALYFRDADRAPASAPINESWRIRPVEVSIAGGTATITGHAALLVKPILESGVAVQALDPTVTTNFVEEVSVYRVYTDTATVGSDGYAYWEAIIGDCSTPPCDLDTKAIECLLDKNSNMGQVGIAYVETDCCLQWRNPDLFSVNYLAGEPLVNGQMNPDMAQIVTMLSVAYLANLACGCERSDRILAYWHYDVTETAVPNDPRSRPRQLSASEAQSPFGFSRGALYAWERLQSMYHITGVSA